MSDFIYVCYSIFIRNQLITLTIHPFIVLSTFKALLTKQRMHTFIRLLRSIYVAFYCKIFYIHQVHIFFYPVFKMFIPPRRIIHAFCEIMIFFSQGQLFKGICRSFLGSLFTYKRKTRSFKCRPVWS